MIFDQTARAIEADSKALLHSVMIEQSMNIIEHLSRGYIEDDDHLTIQLLGIRIFNGCVSSLTLMMSGYYQTSALQIRDILETSFLINFLNSYKKLIAVWKNADEKTQRGTFSPVQVRKFLDDRDGFTAKKRAEAYKLLCKLAGHPNYEGFRMLTPVPGGLAHCGPFFEASAMFAVLSELAKVMAEAGTVFSPIFSSKTELDLATKASFSDCFMHWAKTFYGYDNTAS